MTSGPAARVLGPVRVRDASGALVEPPGALPARLVVALALAGADGRGVDGLVDDVWPDAPPRSPRAALQMLVSRTRAVAAEGLIESTGAGYRLADSDLVRAEGAGEADAAAALALFAGEPGSGLEPSPVGAELVVRAGRARRRLLSLRSEQLRRAGRGLEAVPLLEELAETDPLDGADARRLMRALQEGGAPDRALAVFAAHRSALAEALGADPAAETIALNTELLRRAEQPAGELVGVRASPTPLLGREADVAALVASVPRHRLTSVIGTGGLGKTRLAHEVAAAVAARFETVVFTELAGARAEEDVALVVGAAVGARSAQAPRRIGDPPPADLAVRTREALGAGRTLLVLDNCEQVVEAAARLTADLLATVPGLSVLTTSRVPLLLAGEQVVALQPLPADGAGSRLFVERASAARPGVVLDPQVVVRVCARLDGLPLAIELAAARLRSMGLAELDRRLEDRFAVLIGSDRTAPERHRTLFAVIDWSRRLLSSAARDALALLAVFPDGFTAVSAQDLLGADTAAGDVLTELVDQSLLGFRDDRGPDGRYRMLETVREFGLRALADSGRIPAARHALDRWALRFVRSTGSGLLLGRDLGATRAVAVEEETLLAVLRADPAGREEAVVAAFGLLAEHWAYRGDFEATLDAAPSFLAAAARRPTTDEQRAESVRALVFMYAVAAANRGAGVPRALVLLRRALPADPADDGFWAVIGRELVGATSGAGLAAAAGRLADAEDPLIRTVGLGMRAQLLENQGEGAAALALLQRLDLLATRHGLQWMRVFGRMSTVSLRVQRGDHRRALEQGLALQQEAQELGTGMNLQQLDWMIGTARLALGELDEAEADLRRLLAGGGQAVRGDAADLQAIVLVSLAEVATARGDAAVALRAWDAALTGIRRVAWPWRVVGLAASIAGRLRLGATGADVSREVRRVRSVLLAVARIDPQQLDAPVFGAGLLGLAAAFRADRPQVAARLVALALAMSARQESAELARVARTGTAADLPAAEATEAAVALLRSPAGRL